MGFTRSALQGAHYHADVIYVIEMSSQLFQLRGDLVDSSKLERKMALKVIKE